MKINCIIQARMDSTRLPGKVMKPLVGEKTVLDFVVERCRALVQINKTILAIPEMDYHNINAACDGIVLGSESDLAARFVSVLVKYPCDGFVRVCADSPLIGPHIIDRAAEKIREGLDYYPAGWIWGNQAEGFNTRAFLEAEPNMRDDEREHLGLWFRRKTRLTIDDEGDLERMRWMISQQQ